MLPEHGLKYHSFEVHHLLEYDAMQCGRNLPALRSFPRRGQVFCSETSVNFCHTVSQYIQDDSTLHSHRHDKLKLVTPFSHRQFGYRPTAAEFVTSELYRWTAYLPGIYSQSLLNISLRESRARSFHHNVVFAFNHTSMVEHYNTERNSTYGASSRQARERTAC